MQHALESPAYGPDAGVLAPDGVRPATHTEGLGEEDQGMRKMTLANGEVTFTVRYDGTGEILVRNMLRLELSIAEVNELRDLFSLPGVTKFPRR